ncbi:hypothetical protein MSAN_01171300 [Mycena sanguinolenta]|uniref:F-box domain-containing protein n=1 Tax=Mycena sanguinolenta TaxID=230812 RepID=A0A8H6YP19_9AGAR|nr:hypothetical protein MSAN_01171300 [Mycena sanguinolenta]
MARLPLEISSEIFLQSLPFFPEPGVHRVPMLFLAICNAWAQIVLSTPALWAAIHISFPCARAWKDMIPIWLQRARSQPLSVSLQVAKGFDEDVLLILREHGHQLKHLELHGRWREDNIFGGASPEPIREGFSLRRTLELLQLTPNLECLVANTNILLDVNIEKLVHPKFRRLIFGNNESWPHGGLELLMSLPSLETLSMDLTSGTLLLFLKESSPPLVELIIGEADNLGFDELSQCLGLVPHLRRLEM